MQPQPIYSSAEVLNQIQPSQENDLLTTEVRNKWSVETEKKVEQFDLDKRQQTAESIKEINKLVITA